MKNPECDAEVPSDTCADGAHARIINGIDVTPRRIADMDVVVKLDVMILWFPAWQLSRRAFQHNERNLENIEHFESYFFRICIEWQARPFMSFEAYKECICKEASQEVVLGQAYGRGQVVAVGKKFNTGLSAPSGGVLLRSERIGDVIVLAALTQSFDYNLNRPGP